MLFNRVFIICAVLICVAHAARILGIIPTPSYSHQVPFQPLWRELSLRGHQVTTLTTDPINDQRLVNLTEIDLHFSYSMWSDVVIEASKLNPFEAIHWFLTIFVKIHDEQLEHAAVQDLIKNENIGFDLVIAELWAPSMFAFSERFNCPLIGVSSLDGSENIWKLIGNPHHPVLYPNFMLPFSENLTLLERVMSVVYSVFLDVYMNYYMYSLEEELVKKYIGSNYSSLVALVKNVSLVFLNTDPIFHKVKPLVPAVIEIGGGSHRAAAKPLPVDLKTLLDDSSQGFIYFSLGSNVRSKDIPEETREILLAIFAELPYTILWKFELPHLPNKPSNVIIAKWFPQQGVLKHPNIKLFITQGGLQSMEEAIYNRVPMIGMPFFADQAQNVKTIVEKGFGLSVDPQSLNKNHLREAILEIIANPKYKNKVRAFAELSADQPMTGLERAVWWTEYVLRHKGAKHLRCPAVDLPLYQYLLLDVIGVLALALATLVFILYVLIKAAIKFLTICFSKVKKIKIQ